MPQPLTSSRFTSLAYLGDASLLVFNSKTGGLGRVRAEDADWVRDALRPSALTEDTASPLTQQLISGGFLVRSQEQEAREVEDAYLQKYADDYLHLVLMPTEQCNFRCTYCYEAFLRKAMTADVQEAIARHVEAQEGLNALDVNWFGGEPLLEPEIVMSVSRRLAHICASRGTSFTASMTTNGSLLTPGLLDGLVAAGVRTYQITLDGLAPDHDCRRLGADGDPTFDAIMSNLIAAKSSDLNFFIMLRHNFDPENLGRIESFLDRLAELFAGDPRFGTFFHAIGRWGGPHDDQLSVCEGREKAEALVRAQSLAASRGFRDGVMVGEFRPNGFACYASNPRSFVVGPTGELYKCTVELDSYDRNIVGQLLPSGEMSLDWRRMALWTETNGRQIGGKCSNCHFSPACHGAVCPKEWMDTAGVDVECPPHKSTIRSALPLLQIQSSLPEPPVPRATISAD